MKRSMLSTLVSLFPFFSLITSTSSMLAPTLWPMSARRVCSSDTEYTRLWQYCTISENRRAKALRLTSVLGRVRGRSKMLDFPRVNLVSIFCWTVMIDQSTGLNLHIYIMINLLSIVRVFSAVKHFWCKVKQDTSVYVWKYTHWHKNQPITYFMYINLQQRFTTNPPGNTGGLGSD